MTDAPIANRLRPTHPGELLKADVLPALGKSKSEIARLLGISRQTLHDILEERQPVTAGMAWRIGKLTGTTAESWLRMQVRHDLKRTWGAMESELAAIPTLTETVG